MSSYKEDIQGLIQREGYEWLAAQAMNMANVVEVGSWHGGGTWALCTACPGPVYAVDHWQGSPDKGDATHEPAYDVFAKFMANVGHFPNLRILKMPSVEAATHFQPQSVDMVFIDAGHDATSIQTDLKAWLPICKKLLCGHDWGHTHVRLALEALGKPVSHHPADIWSINVGNIQLYPPGHFVPEIPVKPLDETDASVQSILEGVR